MVSTSQPKYSVTVIGHEIVKNDDGDNDYVDFKIEIRIEIPDKRSEKYIIVDRFSSIGQFNLEMREHFPGVTQWPKFPPSFWYGNFDKDRIQERRTSI